MESGQPHAALDNCVALAGRRARYSRHASLLCCCRRFLHVGYFHGGGPVINRTYDIDTGVFVGIMRPGVEVNNIIGDIDAVSVMRALQRKDGEQIVLQEDDRYGKIVMFRWKPD